MQGSVRIDSERCRCRPMQRLNVVKPSRQPVVKCCHQEKPCPVSCRKFTDRKRTNAHIKGVRHPVLIGAVKGAAASGRLCFSSLGPLIDEPPSETLNSYFGYRSLPGYFLSDYIKSQARFPPAYPPSSLLPASNMAGVRRPSTARFYRTRMLPEANLRYLKFPISTTRPYLLTYGHFHSRFVSVARATDPPAAV